MLGGALHLLNVRTEGFGLDCIIPDELLHQRTYNVELGYQLLPSLGLLVVTIAALIAHSIRFCLNKVPRAQSQSTARLFANSAVGCLAKEIGPSWL